MSGICKNVTCVSTSGKLGKIKRSARWYSNVVEDDGSTRSLGLANCGSIGESARGTLLKSSGIADVWSSSRGGNSGHKGYGTEAQPQRFQEVNHFDKMNVICS